MVERHTESSKKRSDPAARQLVNTNRSSAWPASLSALQISQFRWLLGSNIAFFVTLQGQILTRTVLAWELTHREMSLASINLAFAIPLLIASVFGGAVSDRTERRRLTMIGQTLVIGAEAFILTLLVLGRLEFWHLLCAAVVMGFVFPFVMPARMALVYDVVGLRRLGNAMALSSGIMNLARVLGPAMMGLIIDLYTVTGAYVASVTLYTIGLFSMFGISKTEPRKSMQKHLLADVAIGFRYIAGHRQLLVCLLFGLVPMFLAMPVQNLMVVFADEVWDVGERGLGMLLASAGMGGVLGSVWVARHGENPNRVKRMVLSALAFGALLLLFGLSTPFYLGLIMLFLANIFASASQTFNHTAMQVLVDDSVRGRMSAFILMSFGLTPLGVLPLAFAAEHIGVASAVTAASAALIAAVILFYVLSPTLRRMDESVKDVLRENDHRETPPPAPL